MVMCWQQSFQQSTKFLQYSYCEIILQFITVKIKYSTLFVFFYSNILQHSRQQSTVILQYSYCEIILQFITVKIKYSTLFVFFLQ